MSILDIRKDGFVRASDLELILLEVAQRVGDEMAEIRSEADILRKEIGRIRSELEAERRLRMGMKMGRGKQ